MLECEPYSSIYYLVQWQVLLNKGTDNNELGHLLANRATNVFLRALQHGDKKVVNFKLFKFAACHYPDNYLFVGTRMTKNF
jgi:hypothetical protein